MIEWLKGKHREAAMCVGAAKPDVFAADRELLVQARAKLAGGEHRAAKMFAQRLLDESPELAEAHCIYGAAAFALGDHQDALDAFQLAAHFAPGDARAHAQLGKAMRAVGQFDDARESLERSIGIAPTAETWRELALTRLAQGAPAEAVDALDRALALAPRSAAVLSDLGYVLGRSLGRIEAAMTHLESALRVDPDYVDALVNRGMLRQQTGDFDGALVDYERALAIRDVPEARLNRGLVRLLHGDFERGWPDYEVRALVQGPGIAERLGHPRWDGADLAGKTILVCGEQGLGDEIMFASCLPDVVARAGRVILLCSPRLVRLFARSFPTVHVHGGGEAEADVRCLDALPKPDVVTSIGSLPYLLDRRADGFPDHGGYLRPDPLRVAYWRERLGASGAERTIGLSWRGGAESTRRAARSIDLAALVPWLRHSRIRFVSLQYGDVRAEIDAVATRYGVNLLHVPEAIDDLDEMAALTSALDEVISVCTALIHLAGALGRPTTVMTPSVPDWRYLRSGVSMPWYPSVRLVRQASVGDWSGVVEQIGAELDFHGARSKSRFR